MLDGSLEVCPKLFYRFSVKRDSVGDSYDLPREEIVSFIKLDPGPVSFVGHYIFHGDTSNVLNHSRSSST